jgi:hypothetical protein
MDGSDDDDAMTMMTVARHAPITKKQEEDRLTMRK